MKKVIVIGATAAGTSMAAKLNRLNKDIELEIFEKRAYPSLAACGLPYYVGGMIDDEKSLIARSLEQFEKDGIHIRTNQEVIEVNHESKELLVKDLGNESRYIATYDELVIASGASPFLPKMFSIDHPRVITLHSLEDGNNLKKLLQDKTINNIAVIGGGYIGLELIDTLSIYNKSIHVVDIANNLLEKTFDTEISDVLKDILLKKNVKLHLNTVVDQVVIKEDVLKGLVIDSELVKFDLIIVSTGVKPNTQFINGVDKLANGAITVNEFGESSIKGIYAIGDCATSKHLILGDTYIPLATIANKYGRHLASIINGDLTPMPTMLGAACLKVYDAELARVGITEKEASDLNMDYKVTLIDDLNHPSYYPNATNIKLKVIYDANDRTILGAQAIGENDVIAKIDVLALAIQEKITIDKLKMLDLPYAPPFSRTWHILNTMANISK